MSKRGWILLGSAVPVLVLFALLGWASTKSGGRSGGIPVNSKLGELRVSLAPARPFSLELLDGRTLALADLRGIPEKYFVSHDGILLKKFVGPMDAATLRRVLDGLLTPGLGDRTY